MPQYSVIVAESAKTMLGVHIKFIAQINLPAAKATKQKLLTAIRSLKDMPDRFPFFDNECIPRNKYHKMFVENWYLILYQIKDRNVFVDYIIDCRQDNSWLLR